MAGQSRAHHSKRDKAERARKPRRKLKMLATMLNSRLALLTADADIHEEFRKVHARLDNLEREWKKIREEQQHAAVSLTHAVVRNGAAAMPPAPAALLNAGANCWDGCNSRQGACSTGFCGAQGVCCRVGFANSPAECGFMGSAGCKSSHCCTLPAKPAKAGGAMGFSADSAVMYAPCSTRFPHMNKGGRYCCQSPTDRLERVGILVLACRPIGRSLRRQDKQQSERRMHCCDAHA